MGQFIVDAEIYGLSEKFTRTQLGLWVQVSASIIRLGSGGLVAVKDLKGQPSFTARDLNAAIDAFCRQSQLFTALDKDKVPLDGFYTNREVCYLQMGEVKEVKPEAIQRRNKRKAILNPQQEIIREQIIKCFPDMTVARLNEAIIRWQDAYPGMDLVKQAKAAELWSFQKGRRHKNHVSFLGNWFKNQTKYGDYSTGGAPKNTGVRGIREI